MSNECFQMSGRLKKSIIMVVVEGLLSGCNFLVLFQVLNLVFEETVNFEDVIKQTFILGGIFVLRLVIYVHSYVGSQIGGSDVSKNVRNAIGDKLKQIPLGLFTKKRTGFYINAATSEVSEYEQILTHKLADIVKYSILLMAVGLYACTLYLPVGIMMLFGTAMVIPSMKHCIKQVQIHGGRKNMAREENVSAITEYLSGSQTLRSYSFAGVKNVSLTQSMKKYSNISYHYEAAVLPIGFIFYFCGFIVLALSVLLSVQAWNTGTISSPVMIVLMMLPLFTSKVNLTLFISLTAYRNLKLSKDKIDTIFVEQEEATESKYFMPKHMDISFSNVKFSYIKGEQILNHADFIINEHTLTAIVGDSGSGKSTILNLIAKYYTPDEGNVLIGGKDTKNIPSEQVLSYISMVDQDVFLFNDTVKENIRYANPKATDEKIIEACRLANCDEFIRTMENGYETEIGENGNKLSGGERQRLSVARAIVKNAPILLLDEATASLDIENEILVKEAVSQLLKSDKTVVMIAHTLPIVRNADCILVVDNGEIIENGTHEELIKLDGKYATMWRASQVLK